MASIVRLRKLRTGDAEFQGETVSDPDQFLMVVDERISKAEALELFLATGEAIPQLSTKLVGGVICICKGVTARVHERSAFHWLIRADYKEIENEEPEQNTGPQRNPGGGAEDWSPGWSVRTQVIFEEAAKAYFMGGFPAGAAATRLEAEEAAGDMSVIQNSAGQAVVDAPQRRRRIRIYSLRFIQSQVPVTLIEAEGKINSNTHSVSLGYNHDWEPETALIDSVNFAPVRYQGQTLVQIEVEVIWDPDGWRWLILDEGTAARFDVGDPDGKGGTVSASDLKAAEPRLRALKDPSSGQPIADPVPLDGDGQPIEPGDDFVFGEWLGFETVDFETVALIEDL